MNAFADGMTCRGCALCVAPTSGPLEPESGSKIKFCRAVTIDELLGPGWREQVA